jgi:5-methylcytosine-specific restriction enzyme A
MPWVPPPPCRVPRCPLRAVYRGLCAVHTRDLRSARAQASGDGFYRTAAWRAFRAWFLAAHPICRDCDQPANEVHHVQARRTHPDLTFVEENCIGLCKACHSKRTAHDMRD